MEFLGSRHVCIPLIHHKKGINLKDWLLKESSLQFDTHPQFYKKKTTTAAGSLFAH
jgi:hypothetical protein